MNSTDTTSTCLRIVQALMESYSTLTTKRMTQHLAIDFSYRVLPYSLCMPRLGRAEFSLHAEDIFGLFDEFRMVPIDTWEDKTRDTVIVHAFMEGILKKGGEEWRNECMLIVRLSEDGTEVLEMQEFVDSAKAMELGKKHGAKFPGMPFASEGLGWSWTTMIFGCLAVGTLFGAAGRVFRPRYPF